MRILGLHIIAMWRPHSKETSQAFDSKRNVTGRSISFFKGNVRREKGNLGSVETQNDVIFYYNSAGLGFKAIEMWQTFRKRNSDDMLIHTILDKAD